MRWKFLAISIMFSLIICSCGGTSKEDAAKTIVAITFEAIQGQENAAKTMVAETLEAFQGQTETAHANFLLTPSATNTPTQTNTPTATPTITPIPSPTRRCGYVVTSCDKKDCSAIILNNNTGSNASISVSGSRGSGSYTIPPGPCTITVNKHGYYSYSVDYCDGKNIYGEKWFTSGVVLNLDC